MLKYVTTFYLYLWKLLGDYRSHIDTLNQVSSHLQFSSIFILFPHLSKNVQITHTSPSLHVEHVDISIVPFITYSISNFSAKYWQAINQLPTTWNCEITSIMWDLWTTWLHFVMERNNNNNVACVAGVHLLGTGVGEGWGREDNNPVITTVRNTFCTIALLWNTVSR